MSDKYTLPESALGTLLGAIATSGRRVLGPKKVAGRIEIADIKTTADLARDAQSTVSAKATVFPKVERLLKYRFEGGRTSPWTTPSPTPGPLWSSAFAPARPGPSQPWTPSATGTRATGPSMPA